MQAAQTISQDHRNYQAWEGMLEICLGFLFSMKRVVTSKNPAKAAIILPSCSLLVKPVTGETVNSGLHMHISGLA